LLLSSLLNNLGTENQRTRWKYFSPCLGVDLLEALNHLGAENQYWSRNIFAVLSSMLPVLSGPGRENRKFWEGLLLNAPAASDWEEKNSREKIL